jgi:hypothetical protein
MKNFSLDTRHPSRVSNRESHEYMSEASPLMQTSSSRHISHDCLRCIFNYNHGKQNYIYILCDIAAIISSISPSSSFRGLGESHIPILHRNLRLFMFLLPDGGKKWMAVWSVLCKCILILYLHCVICSIKETSIKFHVFSFIQLICPIAAVDSSYVFNFCCLNSLPVCLLKRPCLATI